MSKTQKKDPMPSYYDDRAEGKPEEDKFHRRNFAQRIADTIAVREDKNNIVIGIFGAWGTGKTTVLRFIQHQLTTEYKDKVICIEFNPWRFNDEDKLLIGFFQEISEALGVPLELWTEKVGKFATEASDIVDKAGLGVLGKIAELIGITLSSKTLQEFKERVKNHLQEKKKPLVIFMDDLDRLDKSEIQAVFRLVKLTGDFPYTTYILAFDENKVAKVLAEQYSSYEDDKDGHSFLEKIVQVPLHLPRINSGDLDKYVENKIIDALYQVNIELPKEQLNLFFRWYRSSLKHKLQTPRLAKLYANTLLFALPILRDEVDTIDLMLLEGLRLFYPQIYDFIRSNRALFLGEDFSESIRAPLQGSQPQRFGMCQGL